MSRGETFLFVVVVPIVTAVAVGLGIVAVAPKPKPHVVIVPVTVPTTTSVGRTVVCTNADGWQLRTTPEIAARNHLTHCQETP